MTDDTARAFAYLSRVAEPPCPELAELVATVGPIEAADRVVHGKVGERLANDTEARRRIDCAAKDLELLSRLGGRLVTADDDEWPLLSFAAFGGVDARLRPAVPSADGALGGGTWPPATTSPTGPRRSSVPERALPTVSTSRPTWLTVWRAGTSPWCRAARTASTGRPTAPRLLPTG